MNLAKSQDTKLIHRNQTAFLYTNNERSEREIRERIPFTITLKQNKAQTATWMELETLILSEISQKDKDKYHMISLITGT